LDTYPSNVNALFVFPRKKFIAPTVRFIAVLDQSPPLPDVSFAKGFRDVESTHKIV